MTRIIAGVAGGRRLVTPSGAATRPTADRTREALFSTVEALCGGLSGRAFLDLYAGSGAVGLEAASRGAEPVVLVERSRVALRAIRANCLALGLPGVQLRAESATDFLAGASDHPFDVVFLDPPYATDVTDSLVRVTAGGWLAADGLLVIERATVDAEPAWPEGLATLQSRRYGDSTLWYGSRS